MNMEALIRRRLRQQQQQQQALLTEALLLRSSSSSSLLQIQSQESPLFDELLRRNHSHPQQVAGTIAPQQGLQIVASCDPTMVDSNNLYDQSNGIDTILMLPNNNSSNYTMMSNIVMPTTGYHHAPSIFLPNIANYLSIAAITTMMPQQGQQLDHHYSGDAAIASRTSPAIPSSTTTTVTGGAAKAQSSVVLAASAAAASATPSRTVSTSSSSASTSTATSAASASLRKPLHCDEESDGDSLQKMITKSSSFSSSGQHHHHKQKVNKLSLLNSSTATTAAKQNTTTNFNSKRAIQKSKWFAKFEELCEYQKAHGDCLVPHNYAKNLSLSKWVKRQRYQYKLKMQGDHHTLTDDREDMLNSIGFVWSSHAATWDDRLQELQLFRAKFGHCNVSSDYSNQQLSVWVKYQRHQRKLFMKGMPSNMTKERMESLDKIGFAWKIR